MNKYCSSRGMQIVSDLPENDWGWGWVGDCGENAFARTIATYQVPEVLLICFSKASMAQKLQLRLLTWLSLW